MPSFRYEARDRQGQRTTGLLEAPDASGVAAMMGERGLIPLRIVAEKGAAAPRTATVAAATEGGKSVFESLSFGRRKVSDVELQLMTRELHAMLKAGVPIMRALQLLQESTRNPAVADTVRRIAGDLDSGLELATAMDRERLRTGVFEPYFVSLVRIGEETGRLEEGLLNLSKHLQFLRETREMVQSALRYPMFVIVAMLAAIVVVNLYVLPQFEKVFKGMNAKLPSLTVFLLETSRVFVKGWPIMLVASVAAVFAFKAWKRSASGAEVWDRLLLRMPIVGDILQRTALARFATSLATALRSGVPVAQALTIVAETIGSRPYAQAVEGMRARVERGDSLRAAAAVSGMFPPVLQQVISVGEETGALDELLGEIGAHYQGEVTYALSKLGARVEPILIVVLGAVVLVLALGVFMPMWEMGRASMGGK